MAGFTQNIFGRGKLKRDAYNSISFEKYFKNCAIFYDFQFFCVSRIQRDPLWRYRVEVNYQLSNAFMTNNDKVLQELIKQQLEDEKNLIDHENIVNGSILESTNSNTLTISKLPSAIRKCPSSTKLLGRPWLIKVQTNCEGKPPILTCYAIDEEGEIIEVEGKPLLIPPILGPEAKQEVWKPKGWKPIRQTLKLHEIAPSPKCPKHQHLQKSKKYELIRETLLQATIVTTKKEGDHPQTLLNEFSKDLFTQRLRKLSGDLTSPNWIPPKWTVPKEEMKPKPEATKEDESSSSSSESLNSNTSSSSNKEGASNEAKNKQKEEEEKKRLEEKKKKKEKKRKIRDEKQRQWRLELREAAGQAAFAGTYATRVGGLGRPF